MCGIAGYWSKSDTDGAAGDVLLSMLTGLGRRGPDSAGIALYTSQPRPLEVAWVRVPEDLGPTEAEQLVVERASTVARIDRVTRRPSLVRLELERRGTVDELRAAVERPSEDVEIVSLGRHLELVKQVGSPQELEDTFEIGAAQGSHGIGHTRLSTESRVDLSHSQPFWARGVADLATVHNGHITNYHKLRRLYEQRGVRFFSENDSEVDRRLSRRPAGPRAARSTRRSRASLDDFDGSFTYLVATAGCDRLRPRPVRPQAADHRRDRRLRRDRERGGRDPRCAGSRRRRA